MVKIDFLLGTNGIQYSTFIFGIALLKIVKYILRKREREKKLENTIKL